MFETASRHGGCQDRLSTGIMYSLCNCYDSIVDMTTSVRTVLVGFTSFASGKANDAKLKLVNKIRLRELFDGFYFLCYDIP